MAQPEPIANQLLCTLLDDDGAWRAKARDLGALKRQGKLDVYALLVTVVLGIAVRGPTAIAQLGHLLSQVTGTRFARSSVWSRFTPAFRDLVQAVLDTSVREARARPSRPPGVLAGFRDILSVDATVVKVDDSLRKIWRGTRRNSAPAAVKLHTWVRAFTGELLKYRLTADAHGDGRAFGVDHDLRGVLVIFDKAYSSPSLWRRIENVGGYFLTRLPADRDPRIVRGHRRHRGRARRVERRRLRRVLDGLQRQILDVDARFRCQVRRYRSARNRWVEEEFRLVAIRDHQGRYEVFVTNAPPDLLPAEVVSRTYQLRWEVETFYKTAKSGCGLADLPSRKAHIVETLLYAALLRATTSMQALARFRKEHADLIGVHINPGQWQGWWNGQLRGLIDELVRTVADLEPTELARMLGDPNIGRMTTRRWFVEERYGG
jgi:putative transposase